MLASTRVIHVETITSSQSHNTLSIMLVLIYYKIITVQGQYERV